MRKIGKLAGIALAVAFMGSGISSCTPPPDLIEPFSRVRIMPADGKVNVGFWLKEETIKEYQNRFGHFILLRSQEGEDYVPVAEFGPVYPPRATWVLTDSTVTNSTTYNYVLKAVFALLENPDAEGYSDTLSATPAEGLIDPRPPAPESLSLLKPLAGDTVQLTWNPPPDHDSLYYLLYYSHDVLRFVTYQEDIDDLGRDWDPGKGDKGVNPVRLDSAYYRFICDRDGEERFYRVVSFRDSCMSYPSEILTVEHTWQP